MSKLIYCDICYDIVLASLPSPTDPGRVCRCGRTRGFFLPDRHHVAIIGSGMAFGIFNGDVTEAAASNLEAGYWPIRLWRIPDGDRIIIISAVGGVVAPCTRCKPFCRFRDWAIQTGETLRLAEVKRRGATVPPAPVPRSPAKSGTARPSRRPPRKPGTTRP